MQQMNTASLENQLERFNLERRDLMDKVDRLQRETGDQEKLISQLQGRLDNASNLNDLKEREMIVQNRDLQTEKGDLLGKLEAMREK